MKDITVLITAGGAPFMPGLVKALRANGERKIRIIGVDMCGDPTANQMTDGFFVVPGADDENYIDEILKICRQENVDIVLPFMSKELLKFHSRKDDFTKIGTIVSLSDPQSIGISNNKLKLYEYLRSHGVETPRFCPVREAADLDKAFSCLGYPDKPVCIKAAESSGSRGIRVVDTSKSRYDLLFHEKPSSLFISFEELKEILSERETIPEMFSMEYLPGSEYSVDVLAQQGETLYIAGRKSEVVNASIQQDALICRDEKAYQICREIIKLLEMDGTVNFDFKYDGDGKPVLMEINPRISATMAVHAAAGVNFPYLRIKQLLKEELPSAEIHYGVRMKRRYIEMYADENGNAITI